MHYAAIALLIAGQAVLVSGLGTVTVGAGELMIFAATLLWAVEVASSSCCCRSRLRHSRQRGSASAPCCSSRTCSSGRWSDFVALDGSQWAWALLTGTLLAGYVATWYAALARAQAVDVTAVLVLGVVVTAVLDRVSRELSSTCSGSASSSRAAPPRRCWPLDPRTARHRHDGGALLFARYAYPPNALGYCGADENRTLLEYGEAG